MTNQTNLNLDKALIFRITHRENVTWILRNGIACRGGVRQDPNFRLLGIICHSAALTNGLAEDVSALRLDLKVICRPNWYF